MAKSQLSQNMFTFKTTLFFHKHAVHKTNGTVSIYLRLYVSSPGQYEEDHVPLKIRWDHDKIDREACQLLPRFKGDTDVNDYNMVIMTERGKLNNIAKVYRLREKLLTMNSLKRELRYLDKRRSLVAYMLERRKELYNKREISEQTSKNYGNTINKVERFNADTRFDEINHAWMKDFRGHLKKLDLKPNTIWTTIKDVKSFLRIANEEAMIYVDQDAIDFENKYTKTPTTFLNRVELNRLINLPKTYPLSEIESVVHRAFLFSCFTSLRISDIYAANKSWMLSDNFLLFTMRKNIQRAPKTIKIPIIPIAKKLINESLNQFFTLPTQQEYNRTLKDLAAKSNITKRLTSHVGRHTFGYLFMTSVGDLYALKDILGHSRIDTTERYAHIDEEYKLEQAMKIQEGLAEFSRSGFLG